MGYQTLPSKDPLDTTSNDLHMTALSLFYSRRVTSDSADTFVLLATRGQVLGHLNSPGHLPMAWARALADFCPGCLALLDWPTLLPVPGTVISLVSQSDCERGCFPNISILLATPPAGDYSRGLPSHKLPARWTRRRRQDALRCYKGSNDAGYTLDSYQLSRAPATDTRVFNELLLPSAPHVPVVYTAPFAPPRPVGDSPSPTSPSDSNSSSPPYDVSDLPSFPLLSNRVSRKGPNHIPRPPNAFIIFRSKFLEEQKDLKDIERDHRHVSRIAANTWKMFSKEEKDKYKRLAEQAKREHEARYPGYRFAPSRQREKHKRITKRNGPRDKVRAQCIAQLMAKGYRGAALRASVEELDAELDGLYGTGAESDPSGSDHVPSSNARETDAPPFQSPLLPPASSHSSPTGQVRFEPTTYLPLPESPPMASLQDPTVPPHGRLSLVTPSAFSYRELPSDCPPPPVSYFPALYPWSNQVTAAARTQLHLPSSSFGPEPAANDFWPSMDAAAPPLNVPEWQPAPADPSEFALVDFLAAEPNMNFDWNTAMH